MRLEQFINRLDEKVSKREIDLALKNDNIFIGAEFEFISDELENYSTDNSYFQEYYDDAYRAWDNYYDEFKEYENESQRIRKGIEEWEKRIEDLNDEIDSKQGRKEFFEEQQDETEDEEELATYRQNVLEYEEEISLIEDTISDAESELRDLETEREELFPPMVDSAYTDYHEQLENELGAGWSYNEYYWEDGDLTQPTDPSEFESGGIGEDEYAFREAVENSNMYDDRPFGGDVEVGDYHSGSQSMGDTHWRIELDSSLSDGGLEVISPPMTISEFLDICPKMFDWIKQYGSTNNSCGFHIHMSIQGVDDLKKKLDPVKLVLMTDEGYIWNFFDGREFNNFVSKSKNYLDKRGVTKDDIRRLINHTKLEKKLFGGHNESINFSSWEKGHIEFRQMGGSGYERKWNNVKATVAQHAHNLSVACDDTYKQQEYIKRLTRLGNKLDNFKFTELYSNLRKIESALGDYWKKNNDESAKVAWTALTYVRQHLKKLEKMISGLGGMPDGTMVATIKGDKNLYDPVKQYVRDSTIKILKDTKIYDYEDITNYVVSKMSV